MNITASAEFLLTIQLSYLCTVWSILWWEWSQGVSVKAKVTFPAVAWHTKVKQLRLSVGLYAAEAAQGELAGLFKIPPRRAAVKTGQMLPSKALGSLALCFATNQCTGPNQSHDSSMQTVWGVPGPPQGMTKSTEENP